MESWNRSPSRTGRLQLANERSVTVIRHPDHGATLDKMVPTGGRELAPVDIEAVVQGLPEEDAREIRKRFAEGTMDLELRRQEVDVDGAQLREKLGRAVQAAAAADEKGLHVTETTTHDHGTGRTELIVGNTQTAERGRLNRAQRGDQDLTLWYVIIVAVAIIAAAAILSQ